MRRRRPFGLGKEGAYPGRSPTQSDPYRQYEGEYRGGLPAESGPKGPKTQTTHQIQFGPVDIKSFNKEYELVRINTPNVRLGQLLVAIEDQFTIAVGDNIFDFTSAEVSVYGWNSGMKQMVKRQWVRNSTGPFRWVWSADDDQYDSISVAMVPMVFGMDPALAATVVSDPIVKLSATGVWRYMTTHPVPPEYDHLVAGAGAQQR